DRWQHEDVGRLVVVTDISCPGSNLHPGRGRETGRPSLTREDETGIDPSFQEPPGLEQHVDALGAVHPARVEGDMASVLQSELLPERHADAVVLHRPEDLPVD